MDYNILEQLTAEEADAVIAFCIPRSSMYQKCLTFDEWIEQKRSKELPSSFEEVYQQYAKECILTAEEEAREYYKLAV